MIINKMAKFFIKLILLSQFLLFTSQLKAADESFNNWLDNFKNVAQSEGVSVNTINEVLTNVRFLPKVIEYDRYQPEFYEDTHTYISKRFLMLVHKY